MTIGFNNMFFYISTLVVLLGYTDHVTCQTSNDVQSREFNDCLQLVAGGSSAIDNHGFPRNVSEINDIGIQTTCLQEFVWKFGGINWADFNITERDVKFINSLTHSLVAEHNRVKRQVGPMPPMGMRRVFPQTGFRIRREYRRLTDFDRYAFHSALNVMKRNGQYDTFANLHRGTVITTAHRGPNFFGWHRVYCSLIEEALRRINRRVTLPYWDSSLDFDMDNPVNSIIWSTPFLGNGDGFVTSGPFANWQTPVGRLTRNIAGGSRLLSKEVIRRILTRCRTREISDPTAQPEFNLEFAHGGPHVWVGGQMSGLNTAAHDPVFLLHHAFIDYLWEVFRIRQARRCGVNPVTDYPLGVAQHERDRVMDGFPQYRNIDGYAAYWTRFWYRYERSPSCSRFRPFCGTPYLRCDVRRRRCISVARRMETPAMGGPAAGRVGVMAFGAPSPARANRARAQEMSVNVGPRFPAPGTDGRTSDAGFRGRKKRAVKQTETSSNVRKEIEKFGKPFVAPTSDGRTSDILGFNIASGVPSSDQIGPEPHSQREIIYPFAVPMPLIPIPEYISTTENQSQYLDIIGQNISPIENSVAIPVAVFYESSRGTCQLDNTGSMRVIVKAQDLNNMKVYDKHVTMNTSISYLSSAMTHLTIMVPANSTTTVHFTATDGCNRMCQFRCLDGRYTRQRVFRNCNGIMQVDDKSSTFRFPFQGRLGMLGYDGRNAANGADGTTDLHVVCSRADLARWF